MSPEHKLKISLQCKGVKKSKEHKMKMKGNKNAKKEKAKTIPC